MERHADPTMNLAGPEQAQHPGSPGPIIALIPAYNEERFIGSVVLAAREHVDQVLVIDDGSSDRTTEIARRAGAQVVRHQVNQGKACAVNTGFTYLRQLTPTAVVMLDGDGQHCAHDIPSVLAPVLNGEADIAVGSRYLGVRSDIPAYRQVGQHGLNVVTNLTSGVNLSDTQSGFRAFSSSAIAQLCFQQSGFSIESEMQFQVRDCQLRVVEVAIKVIYAEPARRDPVAHGMQVLNGILRLVGQTRPLLFFSTMGTGLLCIGVLFGAYIIDIYSRTHNLAIGYGLITVILCVVGVLLLFAGVLLHSTRGMILDLQRSLTQHWGAAAPQVDPYGTPPGCLLFDREP